MGGLLFLGVIGLWVWLCFAITRWCVRHIKLHKMKYAIAPMLFALLFVLPVIDELAARPQFNELCRNATLKIDVERIKGRTVRVEILTSHENVAGTIIPTSHSRLVLRDTTSKEELGFYDTYTVRGGVMSRWTRFPEGGHPWTMERSGCGPEVNWAELPALYQFTRIN